MGSQPITGLKNINHMNDLAPIGTDITKAEFSLGSLLMKVAGWRKQSRSPYFSQKVI